jgi:VWFA-related protein
MRPKVGTFAKVLLLLALLLVITAFGQDGQDFKIRAKVDLVVVPVTVKGSGDRLISSLTKDDFVVLEDGRKQIITNFTIDPVPLSAAVLVDTGLPAGTLSKIQQTFPALAGAFSEFDEVAVYRYDNYVTKILDFSKDNTTIDTAIKSLNNAKPDTNIVAASPRGPFSNPGPVINGAPVVQPGQVGVITTSPPKNIKVLNDAIFTAASDLAKRENSRRKIVLIVSDGENQGSDHGFDETTQSLLQTNIQVYAIGVDRPAFFGKFSLLDDYAKATGGEAFFVNSVQKIETAYSSVTEQARNQYILGYLSNNEIAGPGPVFRDIVVKLARGNFETRHRKGYYQYP